MTFLLQHVNVPTMVRKGQKSNLLDLVIGNNEYLITDIECNAPLGNSDHVLKEFQIHSTISLSSVTIPKLLYDKGDYEGLRAIVRCKLGRSVRGK